MAERVARHLGVGAIGRKLAARLKPLGNEVADHRTLVLLEDVRGIGDHGSRRPTRSTSR
jgi:hypothetical protein